jgi:hypothetical protein
LLYRTLLLLTLSAAASYGGVIIYGYSDAGGNVGSIDSPPDWYPNPQVGGHTHASELGGSGYKWFGSPPCTFQGCAIATQGESATSWGDANANHGYLKAGARASGGESSMTVGFSDQFSLFLGPAYDDPIIKVTLDIKALGATEGVASLFLNIGFLTGVDDHPFVPLFFFDASNDGYAMYAYDIFENQIVLEEGNSAPGFLTYDINLAEYHSVIPVWPTPHNVEVAFFLGASADCSTDECFAQASAVESLYVELLGDIISLNGYQYLGPPDGPPGGGGVPEPSTFALLGAGVLLMAIYARRRAKQQANPADRQAQANQSPYLL